MCGAPRTRDRPGASPCRSSRNRATLWSTTTGSVQTHSGRLLVPAAKVARRRAITAPRPCSARTTMGRPGGRPAHTWTSRQRGGPAGAGHRRVRRWQPVDVHAHRSRAHLWQPLDGRGRELDAPAAHLLIAPVPRRIRQAHTGQRRHPDALQRPARRALQPRPQQPHSTGAPRCLCGQQRWRKELAAPRAGGKRHAAGRTAIPASPLRREHAADLLCRQAGGPNLLDLKLCIVPTVEWTAGPR